MANVRTFLNGNVILRWDNTLLDNKIRFAVEARVNGWVGFGIARTAAQRMVQADIVIGRTLPSGVFDVEDRYATDFLLPVLDTTRPAGVDNLEDKRGGITNGEWTSMEFTRTIVSTDPNDNNIRVGQPTDILLAYGQVNGDILYHGGADRTMASVQFLDGQGNGSPGGNPPPPPGPGGNPVVPCQLGPAHTTNEFRPFFIRMNMQWSKFECNDSLARLARFFGILVGRIKVLIAREGSVILELQISHDATDNDPQLATGLETLMADVEAGSPNLRSAGLPVVSATSGSRSAVNPPGASAGTALEPWVIALIVIGGLFLIVAIIVVVVIVRKRQEHGRIGPKRDSMNYALLDDRETSMSHFSAPIAAAAPSDGVVFSMTAKHSVPADKANHVLGATSGQKFQILQSDWEASQGADWLWALDPKTGEQGYIPRLLVE